MAQDYTKTLNLPATSFSMKANLTQREPLLQQRWAEDGIYQAMQDRRADAPLFILHDGPPFSNGNIHMGTAMNKVLKDFILKYKSMTGFRAPYIPGWDNHGMPIESAIIKQKGNALRNKSIPDFRDACHDFAQKYVDIQRAQFIRLGVMGDWEHPYLTMDPAFEATEIRIFGEMYRKGYIYKGLKPVFWCPHDETALAEAEIDYKDAECDSIYVKFRVCDDKGLLSGCDLEKTYFIIWTTTTWTLPGNLAIAVNPAETYVAVRAENGESYVVAEALLEKTMQIGGIGSWNVVARLTGKELEWMKTRHPFLDRDSIVVNADYVTMDSGTGCVHTAPGFGADDYQTCRRYQMDIIVPVDDKGYQTEEAGPYAGLYYEESSKVILEDMKKSGALFATERVVHSYPHCWRCKHPIIFRATPQWFCSVDAFKDEAAKACEKVTWIPAWGGERIAQMVRERADWCISRQRRWGLPIAVFYCADCGEVICTEETIDAVAKRFAAEGSNAWFRHEAAELLPEGFACPHCGGKNFTKEIDTLDGWFDSGCTHFEVLEHRKGMHWPADLYLEGADQYRGWFQSSLLTAVGAKNQGAPYRTVLTHGWVVDGEGKAMHKSLGNSILAEDVVKKYGADILRSWVAASDYRVDVRVSDQILTQLSEVYRKIRNTARILLANLGDFCPDTDCVSEDQLEGLDRWLLARLDQLVRSCHENYQQYDFHSVYHDINNFCTIDLSKLYVDISKDRLYVGSKMGVTRRAAQTAMYQTIRALALLLTPILTHTAEEIWSHMPHEAGDDRRSILLCDMPKAANQPRFPEELAHWNALFDLRDGVMKQLEDARAAKMIGKSLEAKLKITAGGDTYALLSDFEREGKLAEVFIVSQVQLLRDDSLETLKAEVLPAEGHKCDRCWMFATAGEKREDGFLCARCADIVKNLQ